MNRSLRVIVRARVHYLREQTTLDKISIALWSLGGVELREEVKFV